MLYIGLPSRWVFLYFEDGMMRNVANTDRLTDEAARSIADRWSDSDYAKKHGKVVRVDFRDSNDRLLKFWLIGKNGKMEREPLF